MASLDFQSGTHSRLITQRRRGTAEELVTCSKVPSVLLQLVIRTLAELGREIELHVLILPSSTSMTRSNRVGKFFKEKALGMRLMGGLPAPLEKNLAPSRL